MWSNGYPQKFPKDHYFFSPKDFPLAVRRVEGVRISHAHDYTGIPHCHDFSELVLVTGGEGRQFINGEPYSITEGDVFILLGETVHYFTDYKELRLLNLMFDPVLLTAREDYLRKIPGYNLIFQIEPSLRTAKSFHNTLHLNLEQLFHALALIEDIQQELSDAAPGYEAAAAAQFVRLAVYLSRGVGGADADKQAFHRLSVLLSQLEEKYAAPWDLAAMAKAVHMSKNNLLRVFRAAEGCTPMKYLNRLRLEAACRLLREKKNNISEIAALCGFPDSNYFSKRFAAAFRMSPKKYRRTVS